MLWEGKGLNLHTLWTVIIVASFSFWFGRVTVDPNISQANCTGIKREGRLAAPDAIQAQELLSTHKDSKSDILLDGWRPGKADWAQLGADTGLDRHKPPLQIGDGGTNAYIIQPYQVSICALNMLEHSVSCGRSAPVNNL
jgi:hypothetical protein